MARVRKSKTQTASDGFLVVGIGSSAGGITALQTLFRSIRAAPNLAFVIVQHLSPDRPSQLAELLGKRSSMSVREVADGVRLKPSSVFIAPPGRQILLEGGIFATQPLDGASPRAGLATIDSFFENLARQYGPRAVAVILSGTGSDGAAGAVHVRHAGGIVLVQDPITASHQGMPAAAIATGAVDHVMPLGLLAQELMACASQSYVRSTSAAASADDVAAALEAIVALIRTKAGFDLTGYKTTPLLWRVQHRMNLRQVPLFVDYETLLHDDSAEREALIRGIPIHVTEFFRDAAAWDALDQNVIPALFENSTGAPIRAWTAGCATGEEAYSTAMLLAEHAATRKSPADFQVFATDASSEIVARASRGVFKPAAIKALPLERRQRFFYSADNMFHVKRGLREKMVFAPQDLLADPPFAGLDLVTCRNLLIYLEPDAAKRVVALLHSSLRVGGYLFLGKGESLFSSQRDGFEEVAPLTRIYRKAGPLSNIDIQFPKRPKRLRTSRSSKALEAYWHEFALESGNLPAVLIDDDFRILRIYGDTGPFLRFKPGEPTLNLLQFRNLNHLRFATEKASLEGRPVTINGLADPETGELTLSLCITPLPTPQEEGSRLLIAFLRSGENSSDRLPESGVTNGSGRRETMNWSEELRLTHEELDASREELQALNEELRASNDQLNIANEDLNQANAQLRDKIAALETQSNVLSSGAVMTLFLDENLCVQWFTPAIRELFPLKAGDVGRPITDLSANFNDQESLNRIQSVMQTGNPSESEVQTFDGRWYLQRIRPFCIRGEHTVDAGVAMNFTDITDRKKAEELLRKSESALGIDLEKMTRLHAFSTAILGARTVQDLVEVALDGIIGVHGADFGAMKLNEVGPGLPQIVAHRGFEPWFLNHFAEVDAPQRKQESYVDIETESPSNSDRAIARRAGYRGVRCTPLIGVGDAPLGVISTYFRKPRFFAEAEKRVTDILANELSNALERIRAESALRADVDVRKRTEQTLRSNQAWLAAQKEAFQATMNSAPLSVPLGILIRAAVEQSEYECRCAFYLADQEGRKLTHVVGMPESYAQRVNEFEVSRESLACGLALATGEPVVTPDVLEEPRWQKWKGLAQEYDFRGCWSFPLELASGRLVGSFAMYFREPRTPTPSDLELVDTVTHAAEFIIFRHQEDEKRARREDSLRPNG